MNKTLSNALKELIFSAENIAIIMHLNPDGDAMGSALALYEYISGLGKKAIVISPTPISKTLDWLPNRDKVLCFEQDNNAHIQKVQKVDTVIFVDHSSMGRCGNVPDYINVTESRKAYIDHHPSPNFEAGIAISEPNSAATCCILYEILENIGAEITQTMASCLYTGIVTDTGNFRYGQNSAQVFSIASKLVLLGIEKDAITQAIYNTNTENRLRLLGFVLAEKMQRVEEKAAYITLSKEELQLWDAQISDTDDFANYPLTMAEVHISAIFIEKDDYIKLSFRSRGEFNVNLLARNHFNGGGHKNAAGGRFFGTMEEAVALYIKNVIH